MADLLLKLGESPTARRLVKRVGLPIPLPVRLRRARGAWDEQPLAGLSVAVGQGASSPLCAALAEALTCAGANALVADARLAAAFAEPGAAYGRPARPLASLADPARVHGLVFDASGLGDIEGLRALYDFFHPLLGRLSPSGRVVVLGRPSEGLPVAEAAAQEALLGFVKSVGKEVGRGGATANLLRVAPGAEGRLSGPLAFLLSARSAFVSGQALTVNNTAVGDSPALPGQRGLEGQVALVTGAARGIGAATARALAAEGAHVICLDRPGDDAATSQLARTLGGSMLAADLAAPEAAAHIAAELAARHGRLDVIVHNAGVTRDRTLGRMSETEWDQTLGVNLAAVLRLQAALDAMLRPGGRVLALSSIAGLAGNVGQTNYAASKAGIVGFARALSPLLGPRGITVNAVAPGFIETRLTAAIPFTIREAARRMSSLGQGGLPEDVAQTITFLASPAAQGLTGNVVRVCGQSLVGA